MKNIENEEEFNTLITEHKLIVLDFYADWCGPCQTLMPTVNKLAEEYKGKIEIKKVNVDQNRELSKLFGVRSIPTLFFMNKDKVIEKVNGLISETAFREKLENLQS